MLRLVCFKVLCLTDWYSHGLLVLRISAEMNSFGNVGCATCKFKCQELRRYFILTFIFLQGGDVQTVQAISLR